MVVAFFRNLGKTKLIILAVSCVLFVGLGIFLAITLSQPDMTLLYSDLNSSDRNDVALKLRAAGVPFAVSTDGKEIRVPEKDALNLRMSFALEGIPSSGRIVGYEIFDKNDVLGTSQFLNNINLVRALEGELIRTIDSLTAIENSRVHLVIPKKELFSKVSATPSASIVLKLRPGKKLSKKEIEGITNLVVTAVPDLKSENVTMIDQNGNILRAEKEGDDMLSVNTAYQTLIEKKLALSIEEILQRCVGTGKAKASVFVDIDFDKAVVNSEDYNPEGQVIRSKKLINEQESDSQQTDNVSVATNIPNAPQQLKVPELTKSKTKEDEIINYEISKVATNKIIVGGTIKKLSVAVVVDGIYELNQKTGKQTFIERSTAELEKIKSLVVAAIGADLERGDNVEVISMQFFDMIQDTNSESGNVLGRFDIKTAMQIALLSIIIFLAAFWVLKPLFPKAGKKEEERDLIKDLGGAIMQQEEDGISQKDTDTFISNKEQGSEPLLGTKNIIPDAMKGQYSGFEEKKHAELSRYIKESIARDPNSAVGVIRHWIFQSEKT